MKSLQQKPSEPPFPQYNSSAHWVFYLYHMMNHLPPPPPPSPCSLTASIIHIQTWLGAEVVLHSKAVSVGNGPPEVTKMWPPPILLTSNSVCSYLAAKVRVEEPSNDVWEWEGVQGSPGHCSSD